jgi:hypothetical protein
VGVGEELFFSRPELRSSIDQVVLCSFDHGWEVVGALVRGRGGEIFGVAGPVEVGTGCVKLGFELVQPALVFAEAGFELGSFAQGGFQCPLQLLESLFSLPEFGAQAFKLRTTPCGVIRPLRRRGRTRLRLEVEVRRQVQ